MTKVWVNGCFDLIHLGHIEMLKFAKSMGDYLCVGIDSDVRIAEMKGDSRPFNNQLTRFTILESLKFVDMVTIYDTSYQLEQYIKQFSPNYMVIGEEYKDKHIIGGEFCEKITFFPRIKPFSTTLTAKKIKDSL